MNTIALQLDSLIDEYLPALNALNDPEVIFRSSPVKWSRKEIMGHLIDSAQTNLRRFVVAQYEEAPYIIYNQDNWVKINDYQHQPLKHIIALWSLLNRQIVVILRNTSIEMAQRTCTSDSPHTIEWLAADYLKHMTYHLHQVLNLNPLKYP